VPMGGTSAGLAVLGQVDYTGATGSITSAQALANPYDRTLTLDSGLLNALPWMAGTITDSHLVTRDRMGRLVTFMARMVQDFGVPVAAVRGIGLDEETALVVDNGLATVVGNPILTGGTTGSAYFLRASVGALLKVKAKTALEASVLIVKRTAGQAYDIATWPAVNGTYAVTASGGQLLPSPY